MTSSCRAFMATKIPLSGPQHRNRKRYESTFEYKRVSSPIPQLGGFNTLLHMFGEQLKTRLFHQFYPFLQSPSTMVMRGSRLIMLSVKPYSLSYQTMSFMKWPFRAISVDNSAKTGIAKVKADSVTEHGHIMSNLRMVFL